MTTMLDFLAALEERGFAKAETGGGCTAWQRSMSLNGYMLVTDGGGASIPRFETRTIIVGRFTESGDQPWGVTFEPMHEGDDCWLDAALLLIDGTLDAAPFVHVDFAEDAEYRDLLRRDPKAKAKLVDDAVNAAALLIQRHVGQDDGGLASQMLGGKVEDGIAEYVDAELAAFEDEDRSEEQEALDQKAAKIAEAARETVVEQMGLTEKEYDALPPAMRVKLHQSALLMEQYIPQH